MKKKNYSIILCGGLFLASCMSNNDKCLQKLFDEVGVEKSQIHNATHLVTILGNGCKGCIHKALSEIHNSTDTIYGEFYQFNLSSCIRQQNSLTAQFVSFSLSNLANIFYPPNFYNN